jgi:hypothetical protein
MTGYLAMGTVGAREVERVREKGEVRGGPLLERGAKGHVPARRHGFLLTARG